MGLVPLPPSPSPLCLSSPLRVRKGHHESVLPSIRWGKRDASVDDESYTQSGDQKVLLCGLGRARSPGMEGTFPDAMRSPLPLLILDQGTDRQACGQCPSPTSPFRKWILQEARRKERTALWSNSPVSDPGGERSEVVWLPVWDPFAFNFPTGWLSAP